MGNTTSTVRDDAVVRDIPGRRYVAIPPAYALSPEAYRRARAGRITVCALSAAALVFNITAECVPFVVRYEQLRFGRFISCSYSIWVDFDCADPEYDAPATTVMRLAAPFAVTTAGLNVIGLILSAVLLSTLPKHADAQREEKANSEVALATFGRRRPDLDDVEETGNDFPYANLRVINCGQAGEVPCEVREAARRQYEKDLCAAALSMHILAASFALTTMVIAGVEYADEVRGNGYYFYRHAGGEMSAAIPLFAVMTFFLLVAFILSWIPRLMGVMLCGSLKPERCVLMVVDDGVAVASEQQYFYQPGYPNPFSEEMRYVVSHPGASNAKHENAGQVLPQPGRNSDADRVPYAYTTTTYFAAPPQLYAVPQEEVMAVAVQSKLSNSSDAKQGEK